MDKKKILIVSRSFYPTLCPRAFRTTELAKELARQGHEVKVITSFSTDTNYINLGSRLNIVFKNLGIENYKQLQLKGNNIFDLLKRLFNRLALMAFEFPDIQLMPKVVNSLKNEEGYDLLISIAVPYPIHWGVSWTRNKKNPIAKTWVTDCGDPYMLSRLDTFNKWFYFKYVEKWFFKKADYITVPIEGAKSAYYKEFHSKIRVIPQGFNLGDYIIPEHSFPNSPITFAYCGGFIAGKRDPSEFLNFLSNLDQNFKFIVYTKKTDLLNPYLLKLGKKIEIRDYVPRSELISAISCMDFLINFDNNNSVQLPSKLIDYAIAKRPILNIKNNLIKEDVIAFINGDYTSALKIKNINEYDITNVATKFTDLIKN